LRFRILGLVVWVELLAWEEVLALVSRSGDLLLG
jgi:hypothetical protein